MYTQNYIKGIIEKVLGLEHLSWYEIVSSTRMRDDYSVYSHCDRVAYYTSLICDEIEMDLQVKNEIILAALLHDIGKLAISSNVLCKPGSLSSEEWLVMKTHSTLGVNILSHYFDNENIFDYILCHHEKWDGNGYPKGLKEEEIPLGARIISIADTIDAMTVNRSYQKAVPIKDCILEISRCSGTQFDPWLAEIASEIFSHESKVEKFERKLNLIVSNNNVVASRRYEFLNIKNNERGLK